MPFDPIMIAWLVPIILITAASTVWFTRRRAAGYRAEITRLAGQMAETEQRLVTVQQLNHELANARDEKALVEAALSTVKNLAGGLGVSFVPFDAWGKPLPAFTFGELPRPVLEGWAEYLVSEQVRSRCSQCQEFHSPSGKECPLKIEPHDVAMNVYCFPLAIWEHSLGVINLYFPANRILSREMHDFIESLLAEVGLAVETLRMRGQEIDTLRQLHQLQSSRSDLANSLRSHFDSVRLTLNLKAIVLQVRPMANERLSSLRVVSGELDSLPSGALDGILQAAQTQDQLTSVGLPGANITWTSLPLVLPEGQVLGSLVVLLPEAETLHPQQSQVLQTLAAQSALMIENERQTLNLEYAILMQERNRLAREIHDGLAQTLAFLKLHAAKMHTALGQGDIARLNHLLNENKQVLNTAYEEIRLAIDNLRIHPETTIEAWLEPLSEAFTKSTGVPVQLSLQVDQLDLLPEFQAQLVRIVQEALNNVRKHAGAGQVSIVLRGWSNQYILEIIDNGRGFAPEDIPLSAQHGLRGMRERAELIGADFQIISQPERGTTVRVAIPQEIREGIE